MELFQGFIRSHDRRKTLLDGRQLRTWDREVRVRVARARIHAIADTSEADGGAGGNRAQFYAVVAQMMRRILVDHARARLADKRGGGAVSVSLASLTDDVAASHTPLSDVLSVDQALDRLAARDPESARIVELRFFAGLSIDETAHVLDRSPATIKRAWRLTKAWLFRELRLRG